MNRATLVGNLGGDAELRATQQGHSVLTWTMATSEKWKDQQGQQQERTEWHRCVLWGKRAEGLAPHLTKGTKLVVEGQIQTRKWQDKDGNDRYTTEIKVREVEFVGGGKGQGGQRNDPPRNQGGGGYGEPPVGDYQDDAGGADFGEDDIPFLPRDVRLP